MFYNSGSGGKLGNDLEQYDVLYFYNVINDFKSVNRLNLKDK